MPATPISATRAARWDSRSVRRPASSLATRQKSFIDQLQDTAVDESATDVGAPPARLSAVEQAVRRMPDELLAAELQRRGWIVIEP